MIFFEDDNLLRDYANLYHTFTFSFIKNVTFRFLLIFLYKHFFFRKVHFGTGAS
jgi:hypothetical protein